MKRTLTDEHALMRTEAEFYRRASAVHGPPLPVDPDGVLALVRARGRLLGLLRYGAAPVSRRSPPPRRR